jgi:hypothetical protein
MELAWVATESALVEAVVLAVVVWAAAALVVAAVALLDSTSCF